MKAKSYSILLDIYKGILNPQCIRFVTDDNGQCVLNITLLEDRITPYDLTGCVVRMVIDAQQQDCTVISANDGTVTITLMQSMFSTPGDHIAELQIYDAANQTLRLTTPQFIYNVRSSLMNDETVEADPNFSILQNMIIDVSNADATATYALGKATEALAKTADFNKAVDDVNALKTELEPLADEITNKIVIADTKPGTMNKNTFYLQNQPMCDLQNLLYKSMNTYSNKLQNTGIDLYSLSEFTIGSRFDNIATSETNYVCGQGSNVSGFYITNTSIYTHQNGELIRTVIDLQKCENIIVINLKNDIIRFYINNNCVLSSKFSDITKNTSRFALGGWSSNGGTSANTYFKDCFVYNRTLSQEEIKYNFHSNGEDKISTIEDSDGRMYNFSAKSQNVFCKNGSNLDAALNQFIAWKELTMNSDGTFDTCKCADWHSDRLYVEGQTVKNYLQSIFTPKSLNSSDLDARAYLIENNNTTIYYVAKVSNIVKIKDGNIRARASAMDKSGLQYSASVEKIKDGIEVYTFTFPKEVDYGITVYINNAETTSLDIDIYGAFKTLEEAKSCKSKLNFGLNSLGDKKGDNTYILLNSNGYENDIKVNEPLRKVGNVADVIDEDIITRNIIESTVNGSNIVSISRGGSTSEPQTSLYVATNCSQGAEPQETTVISSHFSRRTDTWTNEDGIGIQYGGGSEKSIRYRLPISLVGSTLESVKAYFNSNPDTVQLKLATPQVEQIKSTFVYVPNQNSECNFAFKNKVAPSNSRIQVAQTSQQTSDRLTALENALLLLQK